MVESQMKSSYCHRKFLYTAWVNAGRPDLSSLDAKTLTARNAKLLKKDARLFKRRTFE
jgi:hypothetical protein